MGNRVDQGSSETRLKQRGAVLEHFRARGYKGSSDYETGKALGILRTTAGARRIELMKLGLIRKTTERRPTDLGATAIVWVIVEKPQQLNLIEKEIFNGGIARTSKAGT